MQDDKTVEAYDKIADDYRNRNSEPFYVEEYDMFREFLGEKKKVLDVGCGIGRDAVELIKRDFVYTGIDASWGMLALAKERLPEGDFRRMDFYALDFPDNYFDGFWATASLLHVPKKEIRNVLSEIKKVLMLGGVGFISVKQKTTMGEGLIHEEKSGGIERYFSFYDEGEFTEILRSGGFEILNVHKKQEQDNEKTVWICFFVKKIS